MAINAYWPPTEIPVNKYGRFATMKSMKNASNRFCNTFSVSRKKCAARNKSHAAQSFSYDNYSTSATVWVLTKTNATFAVSTPLM